MAIIHIGRVDFIIPFLVVISLLWEVKMCLECYIFMYRPATGWVARTCLYHYTANIFKPIRVINLTDCCQLAALCLLYVQCSTVASASAHTWQWAHSFIRTVSSPSAHTSHNTLTLWNYFTVQRSVISQRAVHRSKVPKLCLISHLISTGLR